MGSTLLRNVLEKVGLRKPDASDYDGEYTGNNEGALSEVHEFPDSIEPEVSGKREVTEA